MHLSQYKDDGLAITLWIDFCEIMPSVCCSVCLFSNNTTLFYSNHIFPMIPKMQCYYFHLQCHGRHTVTWTCYHHWEDQYRPTTYLSLHQTTWMLIKQCLVKQISSCPMIVFWHFNMQASQLLFNKCICSYPWTVLVFQWHLKLLELLILWHKNYILYATVHCTSVNSEGC